MSETDEQAAIDTLCRYYDAISSGDYSEIPKLCAEVLSVISLYGTATLTSGAKTMRIQSAKISKRCLYSTKVIPPGIDAPTSFQPSSVMLRV